MPQQATTHVWITVFSWRVNGCLSAPNLSSNLVHILTKKNPRSPAETLRDGMIPVVRFSFITITLNITPSNMLTAKARKVSCSLQPGTFSASKTLSIDSTCVSSSQSMYSDSRFVLVIIIGF